MKKMILTTAMAVSSALGLASCAQDKQAERRAAAADGDSKVLVAYFSRTGENYAVGNITTGNTEIVAGMIAAETGATLFRIDPATAYPDDYDECTEVARREKESGARPAIKGDIAAEDYDIVFIGYPNWWGDAPMPVYTFIEKHRWQGKTVIPFCTHEGSGLGQTARNIGRACAGATMPGGLAVRGATAQRDREAARRSVSEWLAGLEL